MKIRDRIKELRRVKGADLIPNAKNWRTHPQAQQDAMRGILADVGYADAVLAYETPEGLKLVDGHLRAEITPDAEVPVLVLDITDEEADKILATHDPVAALAGANNERLANLLQDLKDNEVPLELMGWPEHLTEPLLAAEWSPPEIEELPERDEPDGGEDEEQHATAIAVTAEQRETIDAAIDKCREMAEDKTLGEGRCIELICSNYVGA